MKTARAHEKESGEMLGARYATGGRVKLSETLSDPGDYTLLDLRVPQPGREEEYGVPDYIVEAAAVLYATRDTCPDSDVETIDLAILRLYYPWIRG